MAAVIKFAFSEMHVIANNLIKRALLSVNIPAILDMTIGTQPETCALLEILLSGNHTAYLMLTNYNCRAML